MGTSVSLSSRAPASPRLPSLLCCPLTTSSGLGGCNPFVTDTEEGYGDSFANRPANSPRFIFPHPHLHFQKCLERPVLGRGLLGILAYRLSWFPTFCTVGLGANFLSIFWVCVVNCHLSSCISGFQFYCHSPLSSPPLVWVCASENPFTSTLMGFQYGTESNVFIFTRIFLLFNFSFLFPSTYSFT